MGVEIAEKYYGKDDLEEIRCALPDLEENEDYWWNRDKSAHEGYESKALKPQRFIVRIVVLNEQEKLFIII